MRLMPTSMTTAPGFTQSALTISGRPTAAMRISARRQIAGRSLEREWAIVTVALEFFATSSIAIGLPTIMDRPITTASAPLVSIPEISNNFMHPAGVQGTKPVGSSKTSFATFSGWKPSTSLRGSMARMTVSSSMCFGGGDWTRMPCTAGSAFRSATTLRSSACVVSAGSSILTEWNPRSAQVRALEPT